MLARGIHYSVNCGGSATNVVYSLLTSSQLQKALYKQQCPQGGQSTIDHDVLLASCLLTQTKDFSRRTSELRQIVEHTNAVICEKKST